MWQLEETIARFASERCRCEVDLSKNAIGLSNISLTRDGKQASLNNTRLLQIETHGNAIEDAYIRGDDLIVTIAESDRMPIRTQVYWRAIDEEQYFGFEAIVSAQTPLLDAAPRVTCKSDCASESSIGDQGTAVVQLPGTNLVYCEFAHTSNLDKSRVEQQTITHQLLSRSLEKGVINRARIRGLFLSASSADRLTSKLREEFERSAPPLTT